MTGGSGKENPESFALRAKPKPVTRLNRRVLGVLIGGAGLVGLGACLWAFRARETVPRNGTELRSSQSVTRAEGLERLPHDYEGWRPIPKLGPPAGELGRPVLQEERNAGLEPESNSFRPNPAEDAERVARLRQQDEAEAAAKAQVFFQINHMTGDAVSGDARRTPASLGALGATDSGSSFANASIPESSDRDQANKHDFVNGKPDPKIYATGRLQEPRSPYEVLAGSVIAAALVTGVNSDLPGQMIATVTQNVYDTVTGNTLLIPQGSRLLGQYDSQVAFGQRRVLLVWTRLIMPDGSTITLDRLQGADAAGYSGLEDQVNSHWGRIFAGAAVSSLLGIDAQLAANQNVTSGSVTVAVREGSQDGINQVGQQLTRKNLNVQPTLTVRPGFPLTVIVNKDLILKPYVQPHRSETPS